jgi:hypothetical protein
MYARTGDDMRPTATTRSLALLILLACHAPVYAVDPFSAVRCGADVGTALIGKTPPDEPGDILLKKHPDLGLVSLDGDIVTDDLFLNTLHICDDEYALLTDTKNGVIGDVLKFPAHSPSHPSFTSLCQQGGKEFSVIGVFERNGTEDILPVQSAWRIDETKVKFIKIDTAGLSCGREGISTADGGL